MIKVLLALLITTAVQAEVVEKTVAIVNNELVLASDFKELEKRIGKPGLVDEALLFDGNVNSLKDNKKNQLAYLINEKLLLSEIKRLNLTVTNDRVEAEIKDKAKKNNISETELLNIIKEQGLSPSEYRSFLKESIEKQSLMDMEIVSKLRISDEDALNEYLKSNPDSRPSIDEFSISHIYFSPKKGGAEAALQRAQTTLKKLSSGENFENLARQFSEDPNFSAGGNLGTFKSGEFLQEIEDAISNLKVNETTPVVKSRMGYHIVKVTAKKLVPDPKFERVKDRIKAQLFEASFKRQLKVWLQTKREDSFIRIND
ncbi:MAG: peptidylprolyl isomerase [Bdellovibrio sp.]